MGFAASWIAVRGLVREDLILRCGLQPAAEGVTMEEARYAIGRRKDDCWVIVAFRDYEFAEPQRLQPLSEAGEAVGVQVEEHVMVSAIYAYDHGRPVWCVFHNGGDEGADHLITEGTPPPIVNEVVGELRRQQAEDPTNEVDYLFEAPNILGQRLFDYRIDEDGWDVGMTPLERSRTQPSPSERRPGFLARLFGAR